jgi:wyosine [tRNA(Phe)-imidazoG37] synthetase (radical SAM superfamily)
MQLSQDVIYGPVISRRFGHDLGVNLLPLDRKLCTFDCIYCQYGFTPPIRSAKSELPTISKVLQSWISAIERFRKQQIEIQHTTISGNGEPTMHPDFAEIVQQMVHWRNVNSPDLQIAVLTNGYRIGESKIRTALSLVDQPIIKLDSAIESKVLAIDRPVPEFRLDRLLENITKISGAIIQTMFLEGCNDSPEDLLRWRDAIRQARPKEVQIYSLARNPADSSLKAVSDQWLLNTASESGTILKIPVIAYLANAS